jgi:hypothetical protein
VVPFVQQQRFHAARPDTELVALGTGAAYYVHGFADSAELVALHAREEAFVSRCLLGTSARHD